MQEVIQYIYIFFLFNCILNKRSCFVVIVSRTKTSLLTSKESTVFYNIYLKKYMYVDLSDEVCCKTVIAKIILKQAYEVQSITCLGLLR